MANRTVKDAKSIRGTNPQYLVEKIIRSRIYDSKFWKEECFALTAELLVDKAMEIRYIGGVYSGNIKPTPFICLILKMLQIQPEKDIIVEFIKNDDFKYVRALGAFYLRLTGTSLDCYNYLEPLLNDNRKLRRQNREGIYELIYIDEFVDQLLREERVCDVILPRIQKRQVLEENNELQPRVSVLEEDSDAEDEEEVETKPPEKDKKGGKEREKSSRRHRSRSSSSSDDGGGRHGRRGSDHKRDHSRRSRDRSRDRRDSSRDRHGRDRERERRRDSRRSRSRERSRDRDRKHDSKKHDSRR